MARQAGSDILREYAEKRIQWRNVLRREKSRKGNWRVLRTQSTCLRTSFLLEAMGLLACSAPLISSRLCIASVRKGKH